MMGKLQKGHATPLVYSPNPSLYIFRICTPLRWKMPLIKLSSWASRLCDPFMLQTEHERRDSWRQMCPSIWARPWWLMAIWLRPGKPSTAKGETMFFGNFIDRKGLFLGHRPLSARGQGLSLPLGVGFTAWWAKITEEFGCFQIEAAEMHREWPYVEDPRYAEEPVQTRAKAAAAIGLNSDEPVIATVNDNNNVKYFQEQEMKPHQRPRSAHINPNNRFVATPLWSVEPDAYLEYLAATRAKRTWRRTEIIETFPKTIRQQSAESGRAHGLVSQSLSRL